MSAWEHTQSALAHAQHSHAAKWLIVLAATIELVGLVWLGVSKDYAATIAGVAALTKETFRRKLSGE